MKPQEADLLAMIRRYLLPDGLGAPPLCGTLRNSGGRPVSKPVVVLLCPSALLADYLAGSQQTGGRATAGLSTSRDSLRRRRLGTPRRHRIPASFSENSNGVDLHGTEAMLSLHLLEHSAKRAMVPKKTVKDWRSDLRVSKINLKTRLITLLSYLSGQISARL